MTTPTTRRLVDLLAVALLLVLASLGWSEVYGGTRWAVAAGGGLVLGLGIAALGAWRRWGALPVAAAAAVAFVVLGVPLALPGSLLPTPDALRQLSTGAVEGWWDLLTLVAPVGARGNLLVPAFLAGLVAALVAGTLALRVRWAWPALLPPLALLVGVGLLGTSRAVLPVLQGVGLFVVALGWAALRSRRAQVASGSGGTERSVRNRTVVSSAAVLAVAVVAGLAAPALADPERQRFSLRELVEPPLDTRAYPSPLAAFRKYVKDGEDSELFTVEGLPEGARIRLATLDSYDGVVWRVAPPDSGSGAGDFLSVGEETGDAATGTPVEARVTIGDYSGVWLPTIGQSTGVAFTGPRAETLRDHLGYNAASGTALDTERLGAGDTYVLEAVLPDQPSDEQIGAAPAAALTLPDPQDVPPAVVEVAGEFTAEATTALGRARALEASLREGYFSHGVDGAPTSRAGHGADRIAALLGADQMVGDEEQYAATMALMARALGMPARVVMGFRPEESGTVTVTADDVSAWVEIAFAGEGWVTFDPTPDEDRVPEEETPRPRPDPQPQVQQPPPPIDPPDEPPTSQEEDEDRDQQDGDGAGIWGTVLRVLGYVGIPLVVVLGPCLLLLLLKRRRRRRRATVGPPSTRIAGGGAEVVDTARDLGVRPPVRATRRETARVLDARYSGAGAVALAERADAGVFAPGEPSEEDVQRFWHDVEASLSGMTTDVGRWRRLRARLSPTSLRKGS